MDKSLEAGKKTVELRAALVERHGADKAKELIWLNLALIIGLLPEASVDTVLANMYYT